jgi:hypothetical protein
MSRHISSTADRDLGTSDQTLVVIRMGSCQAICPPQALANRDLELAEKRVGRVTRWLMREIRGQNAMGRAHNRVAPFLISRFCGIGASRFCALPRRWNGSVITRKKHGQTDSTLVDIHFISGSVRRCGAGT